MRQLDDTLRKAFNLEPSGNSTAAVVASPHYKSTIFEDGERLQKNIIQSAWYFHSLPEGEGVVQVDLRRLLKDYDMRQLDVEESENAETLLLAYSQEVNRLKKRITVSQREDDLLSYIVLIGVINRVFENNSSPYSYVVRGYGCIQSDKFLFEYLNSLLALIALYNNQAIESGVEREKTTTMTIEKKQEMLRREARLFHMCTELLSEMLAHCNAPRATHKLLYKEQPRSLGVDPRTKAIVTSTTTEHPQTPNLPMKEFISSFLGGESSIEARIYLCTAKKHEVTLQLLLLATEENASSPEVIVSAMSNIYNAYKKACEQSESHYSLSNHCRFMTHLWFLRTHLYIVKRSSGTLLETLARREETSEELTRSKGILARLLYVTAEAKVIQEKSGIFMIERLCAELDESYNALLDELDALTARFDIELYKNRNTKEAKGLEFFLYPHKAATKKEFSYFNEACKLSHQKYNQEKEPLITKCQKLLRAFHDKLVQEESEELKKKNLMNHSRLQKQPQQALENKIVPMERALKIGHLTEREWWLDLLISSYSEKDKAFKIEPALYDEFLAEREAVKKGFGVLQSK